MKTLTIVIPAFNEEKTITDLFNKVSRVNVPGFRKQIILINDGSTDKTLQKIEKIKNRKKLNSKIEIISYKNNMGKGYAVRQGILKSKGELLIIQDADLEYDPENYHDLIEPFVSKNADVVYGSRFITNKPRRVLYFWHFVANNLITFLSNILTGLNLSDIETGYKVFNGDLIRKLALKLKSNGFGFEPEITSLVSKVNKVKIFEVGISYYGRTYSDGKKITWIDGIKTILQIFKFNLFS